MTSRPCLNGSIRPPSAHQRRRRLPDECHCLLHWGVLVGGGPHCLAAYFSAGINRFQSQSKNQIKKPASRGRLPT